MTDGAVRPSDAPVPVLDIGGTHVTAALAPWITRFAATAAVVGGSIAQSWDLIRPPLSAGLGRTGGTGVRVLPARRPAEAPLIGAAHWTRVTATEVP
ncbi:hypothetical protein [Streptomyces sp. NPDC090080]|uniref:hypothetical protein n=1 Tax=Streptomyces sp. NPDC090080 TaxID=3365939 RepID=UPI00382CCEF8